MGKQERPGQGVVGRASGELGGDAGGPGPRLRSHSPSICVGKAFLPCSSPHSQKGAGVGTQILVPHAPSPALGSLSWAAGTREGQAGSGGRGLSNTPASPVIAAPAPVRMGPGGKVGKSARWGSPLSEAMNRIGPEEKVGPFPLPAEEEGCSRGWSHAFLFVYFLTPKHTFCIGE